jgi:hypothetical protein
MDFKTEIRKSPSEEYLKVFLKKETELANIQTLLLQLSSIRNVNITKNKKTDLTVYKDKLHEINETQEEVEICLSNYFEGTEYDPIFQDEEISSISDNAYKQIIERILQFGNNLEKFRDLYSKFDENGFRDFFLPHLNSISKSFSATGETFNKIGKTDILIQDSDGKNLFIAECKLWKGQSELDKAIDQLMERYVTWRDEKVALIVFNKDMQNFSELIDKAVEATKNHRLCKEYTGKRSQTSYSFIFNNNEDINKSVSLELIVFNCK